MSDDVIWVPFEDSIRERLQFDLDQIRGITNHMPRDVAEGYESSVTVALTALDGLLGRLRRAENDRDLKAELAERYAEDAAAAEARVEALEQVLKADMEWIAENTPHQATMNDLAAPFPPPPHDGCTPCFAAASLERASRAALASTGPQTPVPEQERNSDRPNI